MAARPFLLLALLLCAAAAARADEPRFGDAGEWVPFGSASLWYEQLDALGMEPSSTTVAFSGSPGLLYFADANFAVGAALNFDVQSYSPGPGSTATGTTEHEIGLAPTFAYNVWLGERTSLFPQLQLGFNYVDEAVSPTQTIHSFLFETGLQLNLLFHPTPHFFVGGGPSAVLRFYTGYEYENRFTIALGTVIGGWF